MLSFRLSLLASVALLAPSIASAQSANAVDASDAGGARPSSSGLEEIVVTARKRAESLQDVPIAVTSVDAEALRAASIRTTEELTLTVPGMTVTNQSGASQPFIRGIGTISGNPGFEAAIATYVDGVYMPSNYASKVPFADVERVEVLKGPQGTLFGRNSVGGLINITTRTPEYKFSGQARVAYSRFKTLEGDLYVTGPISQNIAASLSYSFFDRNDGPGTNVITGDPTYTGSDRTFRGKVLIEPDDLTRLTFSADYRDLDTLDGIDYNLFDIPGNRGLDGATGPLPDYYDGIAVGVLRTKAWGLMAKLERELGSFDFMSLTSYRHEKDYHERDLDLSPQLIAAFSWQPVYRTFSQEFQISSKADSSIKWVSGLYFLKDKTGYRPGAGFRIWTPGFPNGRNTEYANVFRTTSIAAFAEATVPLDAKTNLTVGGRYTIDTRKIGGETLFYGNLGQPIDAPLPEPSLVVNNPSQKRTFKTPTWRVIVDREIMPGNMVYASYSRGFKAGNFADNAVGQVYEPEKIDAFEIGYKGEIGSLLRANLSSFYYKYKNQQVTFFTNGAQIASNAASSTIYGGELEIDVAPSANFRIHSGFAYLNAKFDEYLGATCVTPRATGGLIQFPCDASGNRMTRAPKFTATIQPKLDIPTSSGSFELSATYFHSSSYFSDVGNLLGQKTLDLVSARAQWASEASPITLSIFGSNLTNQKYWNFANPSFGGYYYSAAMPRTYGIEVKVLFN